MIPDRVKSALIWVVSELEALQVPYQITGGLAAHLYGAARGINDIDIELPDQVLFKLPTPILGYLTFGPAQYKDSTWDLLLAVAEHHGQLIDLCGADSGKISNKHTGNRDSIASDLSRFRIFSLFGKEFRVAPPEELIDYKSKIAYDEEKHLHDVSAIKVFKQW